VNMYLPYSEQVHTQCSHPTH